MKTLIFGVIMLVLGYVYGRDETLWQKTVDVAKKVYEKVVEVVKAIIAKFQKS